MKKLLVVIAMVLCLAPSCKKTDNNLPVMQIVTHDSLNGDVISFSRPQTILYSHKASGSIIFNLDFTNSVVGTEIILSSSLSQLTQLSFVGSTSISLSNNPIPNPSATNLNMKLTYLGLNNGQNLISVEYAEY